MTYYCTGLRSRGVDMLSGLGQEAFARHEHVSGQPPDG
jgi:hypothetical protein